MKSKPLLTGVWGINPPCRQHGFTLGAIISRELISPLKQIAVARPASGFLSFLGVNTASTPARMRCRSAVSSNHVRTAVSLRTPARNMIGLRKISVLTWRLAKFKHAVFALRFLIISEVCLTGETLSTVQKASNSLMAIGLEGNL